MNQYGTGQNAPAYAGQQESDLVNNPRYTGQAAGTNPLGHDGRGPADESRYGAVPLSTGTGRDQYGNPQREGMVDKMKDAVGVGPGSGVAGYDNRRDQPGYGTPGYDNYGNPQREGMVDKMKDAAGMGPHSGTTGYDNRRDQPGYGTPGYDNSGQPRKVGFLDKMKEAAGMGPHSGTHPHDGTHGPLTGHTQGSDYSNINRPSSEAGFGGGLGHPHGTNTGYDQGLSSELGTGHHHDGVHLAPGTIPVVALGERRVEPGYDASRGHIGAQNYHGTTGTTGAPRKEGIVEKIKDAVGMGRHDNVSHTHPGTTTGTVLPSTYGTGETGIGHHGNTTSPYGSTPGYSHNSMVDTGLGHDRHPGSNTGYPHETLGDKMHGTGGLGHTGAAGYPASEYPHETMGEKVKDAVGMGPHDGLGHRDGLDHHDGLGTDYDRERLGKGHEGATGLGMHDTRTGLGNDYDVTRTGTGTGYDDTNADYPHNDGVNAYAAGAGTPPKKGIMTKIKEKMHH